MNDKIFQFMDEDVFVLSLPYDLQKDKVHWLYSPLKYTSVLVNEEELQSFGRAAKHEETSDEMLELFNTLTDGVKELQRELQESFAPWDRLVIVPNNKCNFSCSYCYSKAGRNNKELDLESCKKAICDFRERRKPEKIFKIGIVGGGEPALSKDLLKEILFFARQKADEDGLSLQVDMSTNGSVADDDFLSFIKEFDIRIGISFDILPELQNEQRGHYEVVAENIRKMLRHGITPGIKATITPVSANLQEKMVMEIYSSFPGIRNIVFQLVVDNDTVTNEETADKFYKEALHSFFRAQKTGQKHGIHVQNTLTAHAGLLVNRFCPGEYCVTPDGCISGCDFATSPGDELFEYFCYGKVSADKCQVEIDPMRQQEILRNNYLSKFPECQNCFAKYHCGGACAYIRCTLPKSHFIKHCNYTREFLRIELFQQYSDELKEQFGQSAGDFLHDPLMKEYFG